jgi:hypothetical protein
MSSSEQPAARPAALIIHPALKKELAVAAAMYAALSPSERYKLDAMADAAMALIDIHEEVPVRVLGSGAACPHVRASRHSLSLSEHLLRQAITEAWANNSGDALDVMVGLFYREPTGSCGPEHA